MTELQKAVEAKLLAEILEEKQVGIRKALMDTYLVFKQATSHNR